MTTPTPDLSRSASAFASNRRRVAILGAGISGLSVAWRLRETAPELDFAVWEKTGRVGGVIDSKDVDGFRLELSVDNFITTVPWGLELCKKLGFDAELTSTNNRFRRTFVVRKGRLCPLPDGFMTMAPTRLWPMVTTPLLSPLGKLRCGLELLLPRKKDDSDESLAAFVRRRLGKEAFDRIVEPLVGGIYGGDANKLSLLATLPRFAEMERKDRSLIWAMTKTRRQARRTKREEESGARYSFFITLRGGMRELPERLADRLGRDKIELNREVVRADRDGAGWVLTDRAGRTERFDAVVFATPSDAAATALKGSAPEIAGLYGRTEHTGTAIIHLAYRDAQIGKPVAGMGFVVPTSEGNGTIAGSFGSYKYPWRAPDGTTLLRIFVGGARAPELLDLSEGELVDRADAEARRLLGIDGKPILADVARWPNAMPQYYVGRLALMKELRAELDKTPTLALAGNGVDGVGLPACVKSGYDAADKIAAAFASK